MLDERDSVQPNETTVPLLPCVAPEETLAFWRVLGFAVTYEQTKPYLYLAFRWSGFELHYGRAPSGGRPVAGERRRETLAALHRLVAVMRTVEGDDDQPLQERLDELAGGFNRLGLDVTVSLADGIPAALSDVLHGIAREALTNALRYAPGSRVRVGVGHRGGAVELTVDDDGAGNAAAGAALGSGRGLAGARERAAAAGGTFAAGPRPEGGWRVLAVLPRATTSTWSWSTMERFIDVAIVVAIAGLPLLATLAAEPGSALVVAAVAVPHAVPLLWRRRAPWLVLAGVLSTGWLAPLALLIGLAGQEVTVIFVVGGVAEFVAVHAVAAYGRPGWTVWPAVPVAAAGLGAVLVVIAAADGVMLGGPVTTARILGTWWVAAAMLLALLAVAWGEAYALRRRRDRVLASERAALAAAADKAVAAAHAERLAIASELRSVVLHRAAQVVTVAEEGRLGAVADEARGALGAMRELLGSLRGDQPVDGRAPQPTAEAIDALCREHREAGREVTLDRPENAPAIPADVDLSAFRVVEAALSAGDTGPAVVRLEYEPGGLAIVVSGVPRATVGFTMAGMRARADVMGGRVAIPAVGTLRLWLPVQKHPVTPSPA